MTSFQEVANFPPELQSVAADLQLFDEMMGAKSSKALLSLNQIGGTSYRKDMYLLWDKLESDDLYQDAWNGIRHVLNCCIDLYDPNLLTQEPSKDWRLEKFRHYIKLYLGVFKEYLSHGRSHSPKFDANEEPLARFANSLTKMVDSLELDDSRVAYLMFKEVQYIAAEW